MERERKIRQAVIRPPPPAFPKSEVSEDKNKGFVLIPVLC